MTKLSYYSFLALNTHRDAQDIALTFEPLEHGDALLVSRLKGHAEGGCKQAELPPCDLTLWVAEGREGALLPPSAACHRQADFVADVLGSLKPEERGPILERAYDLEAKKRYVLPKEYKVPATTGRIPELTALKLLRPACVEPATGKSSEEAAPARARAAEVRASTELKDGADRFEPWSEGKELPLQLLYLEARQVLLKVQTAGPAVLKVEQWAYPKGRRVSLGSFLVPILQ
ncbi:MAG: hypothetical protein RLZZ450_968 [Pseudomonadota bacterium]|jgi:hypothetical protein